MKKEFKLHWLLNLGAGLILALTTSVAQGRVLISEFMADNETTLYTADGVAADWIELYNDGDQDVDLSGWYLTDNANKLTKWQFPEDILIGAHSYLVIFADSSPNALTNNEVHASFSLSKDGEYLGLVAPDGTTVVDEYAPLFPAQFKDISYGRMRPVTELLGTETTLFYQVFTAEQPSGGPYQEGKGGVGFGTVTSEFDVKLYRMTSSMNNVDQAEEFIKDSRRWSGSANPYTGTYQFVDFHESSASGNFDYNIPFPGMNVGQDHSNYAVECCATIRIPTSGPWTFAVSSDDGFRLYLEGQGVTFISEHPAPRGFSATLQTFVIPAPGNYNVRLVYYENSGGAGLEFSAAQGVYSSFSSSAFKLVGADNSPLQHASAISHYANTDVSEQMLHKASRIDVTWQFSATPATYNPEDDLVLLVRSAHGFRAFLNDLVVAELNMPVLLHAHAVAAVTRSEEEVMIPLEFILPKELLVDGINQLKVIALNRSEDNDLFLIQPTILHRSSAYNEGYFDTTTPGYFNAELQTPPTPLIEVSEPRGYKTAPFTLTLSCPEVPEAVIRYTLDGKPPTLSSPIYQTPLPIAATTTLRAAVVDANSVQQRITTVTWLFLEDILQQSTATPPGWPGDGAVNSHKMIYGMLPAIVNGDRTRLCDGMTNAIATISLVTDLENLFNPSSGIYVNPGNSGIGWERPVSMEIIDPVKGSTAEVQIDAGVRIRGAFSRTSNNPKHSLRLFFRSKYGAGKLHFPLFEDEGAEVFDKVDLRTSQNYSWSYEGNDRNTFVHETFSRDVQREMDVLYTRSRYYHLYINGIYWGLYQTQERGEAEFASTYLGGDKDDWDCVKSNNDRVNEVVDGNDEAFHNFWDISINQGYTGTYAHNYWRVKGLNPDGTPNANYPVYLDEDNLICYMLSTLYSADPDAPISDWGNHVNNMYSLYNRAQPTGFKWLRHDAEHSLGAHDGYQVNYDATWIGEKRGNLLREQDFNPSTLHSMIIQHPEYRMRFADLVQKHCYGDGIFTPANAQALFRSRMDEIDHAIIGESARWGNGKTRDVHWLNACNRVLDHFLQQRRDILIGHFRNRGWFPKSNAPFFSTNNAALPVGSTLKVSGDAAFYYTTDGSDPRLVGGAVHNAAQAAPSINAGTSQTLIPRGATWSYYDLGQEPPHDTSGRTWRETGYQGTASWASGQATLGIASSSPVNPVATTTKRFVSGNSGPQVKTTYFRHLFKWQGDSDTIVLLVELLRDDGAVLYLNGHEILRDNMPAGNITYDTWSSEIVGGADQTTFFNFELDVARFLHQGDNVLAAEIHQCNDSSTDLYFNMSLKTKVLVTHQVSLPINEDVQVLARSYVNGEWGALVEAHVALYREPVDYGKLRVAELMYAPPKPAAESPYVNDDFAWLELRNFGTVPLPLAGVAIVKGISHVFDDMTLLPGQRLVLAKNVAAFATKYSTNNLLLVQWDSGNLARKGEVLTFADPFGTDFHAFEYTNEWYPETYNTGYSLMALDLNAAEELWSTAANWRPGRRFQGSPGRLDAPLFSAALAREDAGVLRIETVGLEGVVELWFSEDLTNWVPCPLAVWQREGTMIEIDLHHPALPEARGFFQLRLYEP